MLKCFLLVVVGVLVFASAQVRAISQQTPASQTGSLSGRVTDSKSGSGVGGALVKLLAASASAAVNAGDVPPTPLVVVATDEQGRFSIPTVPAGSYTIIASKDDYIDGAYGKTRYFEVARTLAFSGTRTEIRIDLWRYAVLTGSVTDESGDPAIGVNVAVLERKIISGRPIYVKQQTVTTDDQGAFRASRLQPGEYTACVPSVQATMPSDIYDRYHSFTLVLDRHLRRQLSFFGAELPPPGSPLMKRTGDLVWSSGFRPSSDVSTSVYQTTCPPSTTESSSASLIRLTTGDVSAPLVIRVSPVEGIRITGHLSGPEGVAANTTVRLLSRNSSVLFRDTGLESAVALTDAKGNFTFMGVPSGQYVIQGSLMISDRMTPQSSQSLSGTALRWLAHSLSVGDADVLDLDLGLREGFQISGRVALDDNPGVVRPAGVPRFTLALEPADGLPVAVTPVTSQPDGTFAFKDIPPGRYLIRARNEPAAWTLREARLDGRDVSDEAFDVETGSRAEVVATFTNRPAELVINAHMQSGLPDPRATVYAVTTDRRFWVDYGWVPRRLREARTDPDGNVTFRGLPPGEYFVLALSESAVNQPRSLAETFELVGLRGRRIQLGAAEHRRVRLPVDRTP